jgi:hypothetical protein
MIAACNLTGEAAWTEAGGPTSAESCTAQVVDDGNATYTSTIANSTSGMIHLLDHIDAFYIPNTNPNHDKTDSSWLMSSCVAPN